MNSLSSSERIMKECKNLFICTLYEMGLTVGLPEENNIYRWKVSFLAPKETPYE